MTTDASYSAIENVKPVTESPPSPPRRLGRGIHQNHVENRSPRYANLRHAIGRWRFANELKRAQIQSIVRNGGQLVANKRSSGPQRWRHAVPSCQIQ